jgi:hypothetical protein
VREKRERERNVVRGREGGGGGREEEGSEPRET